MSFSLAGLKSCKKLWRGACGSLLLGVVATGAWGLHAADEAATGPGIRGVVPSAPCADLTESIESLPESWKAWGAQLSTDLGKFYGSENIDVPAQRQLIASFRTRVQTIRKHLNDPRYRAITAELLKLQGELGRHADLAEAALDTLEQGDNLRAARAQAAGAKLASEATAAHQFLNSIQNGQGWVTYLELPQLSQAASGDPAQVSPAAQAFLQKYQARESVVLPSSRSFLSRFGGLERAATEYLSAAGAPRVEANSPALRNSLQGLLQALEEYDANHTRTTAGAVRKAYDAVRASAPDGGERIAYALRTNYFNYNMRVVADETFLNRFVNQTRQESGGVVDCVLGADVEGCQTTVTDVSLDLKPSGNTAKFDILVHGNVNSNTTGTTSQATVWTYGNHYFTAAKEINFDGDRFWTTTARIGVQANNNTYDAVTKLSWIPILRGIARNIALERASEMRGESEAIASSRIQDRVLPRFDEEVEKQFGLNGSFNPRLQTEVVARLKELGVYPDAKSYSTTDNQLQIATRVMQPEELGGDEPAPQLISGRGMSLLLHESLMNNSLDRMNLAGRTMTEVELRQEFSDRLSKLLNRPTKFPEGKPADGKGPSVLIFDKTDPIRFRVDKGLVNIILRAGFKQEDKEDIPAQIVTIPLKVTVVGDKVILEQGGVEVAPVEKAESTAKQIARANVIKNKLEAAMPRREVDRHYTIEHDNKKVKAALTRVRASDGWLSLNFE